MPPVAKHSAAYTKYMASPRWRAVREARLEKAGRRCEFVMTTYAPGRAVEERCVRTRRLEVHHNRYDRLGREFPGDLDVFCYFHHLLEHLLQKRCVTCSRPCLEHDEA